MVMMVLYEILSVVHTEGFVQCPPLFLPQPQRKNECKPSLTVKVPVKGVEKEMSSKEGKVMERGKIGEKKQEETLHARSFILSHIFPLSVYLDNNQPHYNLLHHVCAFVCQCVAEAHAIYPVIRRSILVFCNKPN